MTSATERGWTRYRSEAYQEALADFSRALTEDPTDYSAVLGAGRSHRLLGRLDDAAAAFGRAHDLRPEEARRPRHLLLGRYDRARQEYRAVAGEMHPVKRRTGAELIREDWRLLRAAGIDVPGLPGVG